MPGLAGQIPDYRGMKIVTGALGEHTSTASPIVRRIAHMPPVAVRATRNLVLHTSVHEFEIQFDTVKSELPCRIRRR
jgi:hypothetical protein